MAAIHIAQGDWEAALLPELGGALLALRIDGVDLLRAVPKAPEAVLQTASFPLLPYANRIAGGHFRFGDEEISLPRNFGDHPHSLHGIGWQRSWTIEASTANSALLAHDHNGGADWPWRYRATQHFTLDERGLTTTLTLTNADVRAMPGGLGFHPYFTIDPQSVLTCDVDGVWLGDDTLLPIHLAPHDAISDWRNGAIVMRDALIDHCHVEWSGRAVLTSTGRTIRLSAEGAAFLHIHHPPGAPFVGLEPVSHMPDAFNRAEPAVETGLRILHPGESMALMMRIEAEPTAG